MNLSYAQLRSILGLIITSQPITTRLQDILSGKSLDISEPQLLAIIYESNIDADIIRILGADPDAIDAIEGVQLIADFFAYIKANSSKLKSWLPDTASPKTAQKNTKTTSQSSK